MCRKKKSVIDFNWTGQQQPPEITWLYVACEWTNSFHASITLNFRLNYERCRVYVRIKKSFN